MIISRISKGWGTILLTITIFSLSLPVYAQYSGGTGEPNDPYQIATAEDLMLLGYTPDDYDKHFILAADIDLDPNLPGRKVFDRAVIAPETDPRTPFIGVFDGNGHTISHLTIMGGSYLGLFGYLASGSEIKNLGVVDVNITSLDQYVGGLVGNNWGSIISSHSSGSVSGYQSIGGLVGSNLGSITACYSTSTVSGDGSMYGGGVGGLVGRNSGNVNHCYSTGSVSGIWFVGGLVGSNSGTIEMGYSTSSVSGDGCIGGLVGSQSIGIVNHCYSTGSVSGRIYIGGLIGTSTYHSEFKPGESYININESYSTARVNGETNVGGLVGSNGIDGGGGDRYGSILTSCYSTGPVSGTENIGGLVGRQSKGIVNHCYSTGSVRGPAENVGGLIGSSGWRSIVNASFWDMQTSGQSTSATGIGLTTAEMQDIHTYQEGGWDLDGEIENGTHEIWQMPEGGGYPVLSVFNGYIPHQLQGLGTPDDPYLIYDAMDLGAIYYYSRSACYRLGASIDLSGICWITSVIPSFEGIFDGNNLTISHLTISGGGNIGLFGQLKSSAEVMDLGVVDVYINSLDYRYTSSGGLVAVNGGCVIRCYATGTVSGGLEGTKGGLVGYNSGTVNQCYNTSFVVGQERVGGIMGYNSGTLTQSYSTGLVIGVWDVGGLVGMNYGNINNSYSSGPVVVGEHYVGGLVGYNWDGSITNCYSIGPAINRAWGWAIYGLVGLGYADVTSSFWDIQISGQATSGGTGKTTAEMQTTSTFLEAGWDFVGETANGTDDIWWILEGQDYPRLWWEEFPARPYPYAGGSGEPNDPYQISTAEDLISLGNSPWDYSKHFILTADIDLNPNLFNRRIFGDAVIAPNPLPYFTGVFNGNGHKISNLTVGLFGSLGAGANIKNLGVVDVNITSSGNSIGGLVGYNEGGTLTNCYSTGLISGNRYVCVGGLVGTNNGSITACYSTCMVNGNESVGGLVGDLGGSITNCYSTGSVSGNSYVGGLVGENWGGSITTSYSNSSVSGNANGIGGLVGSSSSGDVTYCYSTGPVSGTFFVGGLVGMFRARDSSLIQCFSTGKVSGDYHAGGLVGIGYVDYVINCFWNTETSDQASSIGGTGLATVEMQTASTFLDAGWDFVDETANGTEDIWWIDEGQNYPRLWWEDEGN